MCNFRKSDISLLFKCKKGINLCWRLARKTKGVAEWIWEKYKMWMIVFPSLIWFFRLVSVIHIAIGDNKLLWMISFNSLKRYTIKWSKSLWNYLIVTIDFKMGKWLRGQIEQWNPTELFFGWKILASCFLLSCRPCRLCPDALWRCSVLVQGPVSQGRPTWWQAGRWNQCSRFKSPAGCHGRFEIVGFPRR